MARPRGTYGPISQALLAAAADQPGTVRELAARSGVGFDMARKSASRLRGIGALVAVGEGRPSVLGLPSAVAPTTGAELAAVFFRLVHSTPPAVQAGASATESATDRLETRMKPRHPSRLSYGQIGGNAGDG